MFVDPSSSRRSPETPPVAQTTEAAIPAPGSFTEAQCFAVQLEAIKLNENLHRSPFAVAFILVKVGEQLLVRDGRAHAPALLSLETELQQVGLPNPKVEIIGQGWMKIKSDRVEFFFQERHDGEVGVSGPITMIRRLASEKFPSLQAVFPEH